MKAYGGVVKLVITFPLFDTLLGLTVTHAKHCQLPLTTSCASSASRGTLPICDHTPTPNIHMLALHTAGTWSLLDIMALFYILKTD